MINWNDAEVELEKLRELVRDGQNVQEKASNLLTAVESLAASSDANPVNHLPGELAALESRVEVIREYLTLGEVELGEAATEQVRTFARSISGHLIDPGLDDYVNRYVQEYEREVREATEVVEGLGVQLVAIQSRHDSYSALKSLLDVLMLKPSSETTNSNEMA